MHLILSLIGLLLCLTSFIVKAGTPDINIQGLNSAQESNVRSFLALSAEQCTTPKWRVEKLFKQADKDIDKALRALGYYHETINKKLSFTDDCWDAEFTVSAGEPVIVKQLKLQIIGEAEQHPVLKKILANLPLKQGDVLNHAAYEKIKQSLHSWMLEKGYLQAKWVTKSLQVYVEKNQAEISLVMDSGPRHRFGKVTITQAILDPHFVQRYQLIKEGDYYSSKRLAKTYNALANSIYYSHAEIKPAMDHIENTIVPIDIVLTPAKIHDFSIGLGYGTDIGPLGNFGYLNRRLNKQGHHFSFGAEASEVLSSVESAYIIPFAHSRHDHISIGAGYKYEQPDSFESQQAKFSVQYQHASQQQSTLELSAYGVKVQQHEIEHFNLQVNGNQQAHKILLDLQSSLADLHLRVDGRWDQPQWIAQVNELWIEKIQFKKWQLAEPTQLVLQPHKQQSQFELDNSCLVQASARVCVFAKGELERAYEANFDLSEVPLTLAQHWLPEGLSLLGALSAKGQLSFFNEALSANINANIVDGLVRVGENDSVQHELRFKTPKLQFEYADDQLISQIQISTAETDFITANI